MQEKEPAKIWLAETSFRRRMNLHERKLAVHYKVTISFFRRRNYFVCLSQRFDHRLFAENVTTGL